jgi:hypothetical protein
MSSIRVFAEHRGTLSKLQSLPKESVLWSVLCPATMTPRGEPTYPVIAGASVDNLLVSADTPPEWSNKLLWMPVIGGYLNVLSQASGYNTSLEDNADLIASDLLRGVDSPWIYQKVGVKEKQN